MMYARLVHIIATLWLLPLQIAAATADDSMVNLVPVPRHHWDADALAVRDDTEAAVAPAGHERFIWSSKKDWNEKAVVVSMTMYARENEFIIDMEKFDFALEPVTCHEDEMILVFKQKLVYYVAKTAWEWVNHHHERSLVLSPTQQHGCGKDERHPWTVSNAHFNDDKLEVTFDSAQSTWKEVSDTYVLDYGEFVPGDLDRRSWWDIDLDKAFTLDLSSDFPSQIFEFDIENSDGKLTTAMSCKDCGTHGTLSFAGHIEVGVGGVDKFELKMIPSGMSLNITTVLDIEGEIDTQIAPDPIEVQQVPLPSGWRIPGVAQFGPTAKVLAGIDFGQLSGKISISQYIAASIPDSSIAKVDLAGDGAPLEISGWMPNVDVDAPEVTGEIDTAFTAFLELFVGVGVSVLDSYGVSAGFSSKLPQLTTSLTLGENGDGYCQNSSEPRGLKGEFQAGASLVLQGLNEDNDPFFEVTLAKKPDIFTLSHCWPLG